MTNDKISFKDTDFNLDFLIDDPVEANAAALEETYKILIADDDPEVHSATKLILKDFRFEGKKLQFLETYNTAETMEIMQQNPDIAIVLLDVVMDENNAGLKIVDFIRNKLKNIFVRIIIRTGQPGEAPEEKVIVNYDINDYLMKTEITVQRLFTSLYQALRAYRDIIHIENNRQGLEKIIVSSSKLFGKGTIQEFFNCILSELMSFKTETPSVCFREKEDNSGLVYIESAEYGKIIAATGQYEQFLGQELKEVAELSEIYGCTQGIDKSASNNLIEVLGGFLIWVKSHNNSINYIFIQNDIKEYDIDLIKVFLVNYSLALDSYIANQQVMSTQIEIINTLSDAIEKRSHETANHVRRVSEITHFLSMKLGFDEAQCEFMKIASTMHDVGKIGISDSILMKPGKLTDEEFEIMKTHTEIGYKIFSKSNLEVLKKASIISLCHHEKYNGKGYPRGLSGKDIPIEARIVSLVDVFDALTHKRCYKEAFSIEAAKNMITEERGQHFDPEILDVFIENLDKILEISNSLPD